MEDKKYKFNGVISRCIYNSENFKTYAVDIDSEKYKDIQINKYGNVSIIGELPELNIDIEYEIIATEKITKYGTSYNVLNIKRDVPKTPQQLFTFLSEILTYNQANTLYENYPDIVDRVMNDRLDDIDLNKLKGIGEYTFDVIKKKIINNFCLSELVTEFKGYLNLSIIKKIYDKYTSIDKLKRELEKDPYKCLCGLAGVGFVTADKILLDIEKASNENDDEPIINFTYDLKTSKQRCLSCMLYVLSENENDGNTKMNIADLRKKCIMLVPQCSDEFVNAIKDGSIYYNKDKMEVGLKSTYDIEYKISQTILKYINCSNNVWDFDSSKYRDVDGSSLTDEQIKIVSNVCKYNICILNGSAGTGKTYSTKAIINMLKDNHKSYRLMTPTGKSAKVLQDATGEHTSTIHRALGYQPSGNWTYCEYNKIDTDIVIIDEFSMVDIMVFNKIIDAIDFENTKLLIIGDNAQLCSVGCGNLLHDFMKSNVIPSATLTNVFRYSDGGLMKIATDVRNCKTYLTSSMKSCATSFGDNKDYTFIDLNSEQIPRNAVMLYKKLINEKGYTINDIQVLTAKNIGDCGAIQLNNMLQRVANKNYGSEECIKVGDTTYYKNDLIIQKVNNYKAELITDEEIYDDYKTLTGFVANGETGIIKDIFKSYVVIDFDGICVRYTKSDMNMIGLGYAISIHKSQGSQSKVVILLTPKSHVFMLNSNLIYVGLTRMKELCFHFGSIQSVNNSVRKKANLERHTFVQEFLTQQ